MRKALFRKVPRGAAVASAYTIPAPTGGLNKRDSIAMMDERDALLMDNVFPLPNDVRVRDGYTEHVTSVSSAVESLMSYNKADGTQTLFAAANNEIYNVTSTGSIGAAVVSSLTNDRWQHVNFANSAGTSYLCNFNGADSPRYWDGSSWTAVTGASSPAITGITPTSIVSAFVHKRRMYLVLNNSLSVYYLPVDSVGGAAQPIDLGGIAKRGGYVVAGGTWTIDAGDGLDDYWVVVTSEGQLIAYAGTDPSTSSAWEIRGVWSIGEPIGRRCMKEVEGDLLVITVTGIVSVGAIISGRTGDKARITDKISGSISDAASAYFSNFGWEMFHYPKEDMLVLNVPVNEGSNQIQYAMNTITGAWGGPFTGLQANCWAILNKEPYFGASTTVNKFYADDLDNGANISFEQQQAYSSLGRQGILKKINAMRPYIQASGSFDIAYGVNVDYSQSEILNDLPFTPPTNFGIWDTGAWDSAAWGGDTITFSDWQNVDGIGTTISLRLKGSIGNIEFRYQAADVVYEPGGIMG